MVDPVEFAPLIELRRANTEAPGLRKVMLQANQTVVNREAAAQAETLARLPILAITSSSSQISNTAVETDFDQTVIVPAGSIRANGFMRITAHGHATTRSGATVNIRLYLDGLLIGRTGAFVGVATNQAWTLQVAGPMRTSTEWAVSHLISRYNAADLTQQLFASKTLSPSVDAEVKASVELSVANVRNAATLEQLLVEIDAQIT